MNWRDRLLGRSDDDREDHRALDQLHDAFDKVQGRTARLERELLRVNHDLRAKQERK